MVGLHNYLEFIDVITVWTFERPGLRQMLDLVLEMFVSQMEDHRLLADLLLAHEAPLHGGRGGPAGRGPVTSPPSVTTTPPSRRCARGAGGEHALVLPPLRPRPHDGVEIFENFSMSDAVVEGEVVTYLGLVWTRFYWTFKWRRLKI